MSRSTPVPPLDVLELFPELGPLAARTVRLHPRTGQPSSASSSLGGPLLWPAAEAWPSCSEPHRFFSEISAPGWVSSWDDASRWAAEAGISLHGYRGNRIIGSKSRYLRPKAPVPMLPILQLYARDVPQLPFLEDTDLFQLLWCPHLHKPPWEYGPRVVVVWRRATAVTERLAAPPSVRFENGPAQDHVPLPCLVHPETVAEYPALWELSGELGEQVTEWDSDVDYQYQSCLSTAPGSKVGGHPSWIQDPQWPTCRCGRRMHHLVTIASDEFGDQPRWLPLEDRDDPGFTQERTIRDGRDLRFSPHGIMLGDVGSLYVFMCTNCPERPLAGAFQCS